MRSRGILLSWPERFVPCGTKVLVEVNFLPPPSPPKQAIITHLKLAGAVISLLRKLTSHITVDYAHGPEA